MEETKIPRDEFSTRWRELNDHPEAVRATARVDMSDFYGNLETWVIDTFRFPGQNPAHEREEVTFLQRMSVTGSGPNIRLVLPERIMRAIGRHHDGLMSKFRRIGARKAVATRRMRGDTIGNTAALAKARRKKAAK